MSLDKKYYIEFTGAHGAGKTHTYHAIAKQQLLKPYKSLYPGQVKRPRFHFFINCPLIALKNIKHIFFVISFFLRYAETCLTNFKILRTLIKMIILHPYYNRFDFNIFLKDDMLHIIQRIIFKIDLNIEKLFREYFMHFIYLYDGLIFVDINTTVMHERFKKRFPGKSQNFIKSRRIIHNRVKTQSKMLRNVIISQTAVPYLVINGNEEVSKNAEKVVTFINKKIIKV